MPTRAAERLKKTVQLYALTSANDFPQRDPQDWRLLGSNDGGLTGLTLSPDQSRLYVSDRLSNRLAVYSYNGYSASHLFDVTAFAAAPSTLFVPATSAAPSLG